MRRLIAGIRVTKVALDLRSRGFEQIAAEFMTQSATTDSDAVLDADLADQVWQSLLMSGRLPWSTCLTRSLAFCRWAQQRGGSPVLRVGTRLQPVFSAHAWVELGDHHFGQSDLHEDYLR